MTDLWIWLIAGAAVLGAGFVWYRRGGRPVPEAMRRGQRLPAFEALDEQGNTLSSTDLAGTPVVMIFVRGNWCPFCSRQV